MLSKLNICFLFMVILAGVNLSQDFTIDTKNENYFVVDSILVKGNSSTEEFVIFRELNFSPGDTITEKILKYNEERIYSLGIFNFVHLFRETAEEKQKVIINVDETWFIYPIPFYRIENGKVRYGLRVVWKNFRGRNEKLSAMVSLGYNPYYLFVYQNPLVNEKYDLGINISSIYQWVSNPSRKILEQTGKNFDYKYYSNYFTMGKRFDQFNKVNFTLGFTYVEAPENFGYGVTASGNRIDRYPSFLVSYHYDTRDLKQYAFSGYYSLVSWKYNGFGNEGISHSIFNGDFRLYAPLWGIVSHKLRCAVRHTAGVNIPLYNKSFLGHEEYLRGHTDDVREGSNSFISSYEIHFSVIREWELKLDLPLLPTRLTSARIGVHLNAFIETGTVFNNSDPINSLYFQKGFGFGVNILFLPHNGLRFEYAFNEYGKGEFIIGTGLSF